MSAKVQIQCHQFLFEFWKVDHSGEVVLRALYYRSWWRQCTYWKDLQVQHYAMKTSWWALTPVLPPQWQRDQDVDSANWYAALTACLFPLWSQYEAALSQAEAMLLEDGAAFDRFLKESDEKVQLAMRCADIETKAKQEKVCWRPQSCWSENREMHCSIQSLILPCSIPLDWQSISDSTTTEVLNRTGIYGKMTCKKWCTQLFLVWYSEGTPPFFLFATQECMHAGYGAKEAEQCTGSGPKWAAQGAGANRRVQEVCHSVHQYIGGHHRHAIHWIHHLHLVQSHVPFLRKEWWRAFGRIRVTEKCLCGCDVMHAFVMSL